ncbi:5855_t:CDS:2, partial [Acaulospora colombiana]
TNETSERARSENSENKCNSEDSDSDSNSEAATESTLDATYLTFLTQENADGEELIPKVKRLLKEKSVGEKLQEIFKLAKPEQLRGGLLLDLEQKYFFAFPSNCQVLYKNLNELWESHKSSQSMQDSTATSTHIMDSLRSIMPHRREKSGDETSPSFSTSPKSQKASNFTSNSFKRHVSVLFRNPTKHISTFDENPNEETSTKFRNYFALKNEPLKA